MTEKEIRDLCALPAEQFAGLEKSTANYFSCSQYNRFFECEAKAIALMKKEWTEEETTALIFGKYFHSFFESEAAFAKVTKEYHNQIFTQKGDLRADFQKAKPMFDKILNDKIASQFIDGIHEVEILGEIGGMPWRGKIDVLNIDKGFFCDLKAVADITAGEWKTLKDIDGSTRYRKVTFIEAYNYWRQMAVYREKLRQKFNRDFKPVMLAVSKQEYPDIEVIVFNDCERMSTELNNIGIKQVGYGKMKSGQMAPERCGRCDYCRATKHVTKFITPKELEYMMT